MIREAHKQIKSGKYDMWFQYSLNIWGFGITYKLNPPYYTKVVSWRIEINFLCFNAIIDKLTYRHFNQ